jgi:uncharacterized protein YndB with AHSA1/START domain
MLPHALANINSAAPLRGGCHHFCRGCDIQATVGCGARIGQPEDAAGARSPTEVQMPYTYTLTTVIPATPQEIYDAWLDSAAHSAMTGGEANISDAVGAEFSAWDEYITGRNLELVPGERIVQSWRTDKFSDEHGHSTITITFEETDDGTLLTLVHSDVPDDQRNYEEGGWEENYFEPMRAYFAKRAGAGEASDADPPSAPPLPDEEPRPGAGQKPAMATPAAKVVRAKKKAKRATAAKAKRKTVKPSPKKLAKRNTAKPSPKKLAKRKASRRKSARRPRTHR